MPLLLSLLSLAGTYALRATYAPSPLVLAEDGPAVVTAASWMGAHLAHDDGCTELSRQSSLDSTDLSAESQLARHMMRSANHWWWCGVVLCVWTTTCLQES